MASVAKHIRLLRAARHLTQEDLAQKLFVTRQTVSSWETGRSQPDLDTLERIAAALDTDAAALIYGAPQSPDLTRLRKRWALFSAMACGAVLALCLAYFYLDASGILGTWRYGLNYQYWNQSYETALETFPGSYSLELDLNDLAGNAGKVLYEDASGCRIVVQLLRQEIDSSYTLYFQAAGAVAPKGSSLVSGCHDVQKDKTHYSVEETATLRTSIGDHLCPPSNWAASSSVTEDGNLFGFSLFPLETYERGEFILADQLAAQGNQVTVTVSGLTRLTTRYHSSPYG